MLRDAASLILYKNDAADLRVLMGLRHAGHRFMPNKMVFPGGGVDAADYEAEIAAPLPEIALNRLQAGASPELAAALSHAVARELEEETGLRLGHPPDLAGLDYLGRAETPEGFPIRFNARFFVGHASLVSGNLGGSGELEGLDWFALTPLLALDLPPVTREMLFVLQHWHGLDEAGRNARKARVLHFPNWVEE